jgi:hypothetical protein
MTRGSSADQNAANELPDVAARISSAVNIKGGQGGWRRKI